MLLRRVIGDALRARRQGQHRTLREISTAANVSLGYLSEIERGQKEPSSELLAAICGALGSQLSEVLREASDSLARSEGVLVGAATGAGPAAVPEQVRPEIVERAVPAVGSVPAERAVPAVGPAPRTRPVEPAVLLAGGPAAHHPAARTIADGEVSVSVRRNGPLRTVLQAVRRPVRDRVG